MTPKERIEESLKRLEIYVSEHGQVSGTISRQMAQDAIKTLGTELPFYWAIEELFIIHRGVTK